jgi:hypothetical protein
MISGQLRSAASGRNRQAIESMCSKSSEGMANETVGMDSHGSHGGVTRMGRKDDHRTGT